MNRMIGLAIAAALALHRPGFRAAAAAAEEPAFGPPQLRIPKLSAPPAMDGTVRPAEWAQAAALTGFAATWGVGPNTLVPDVQQLVWYLGYDDTHLYLGMRSPHRRGTYPNARVKRNDDARIVNEDHVEIQICPFPRDKARTDGFGFYKAMINPKEAVFDWHYHNGTPGTEHLWSIGGPAKCDVTEEYWDLEVAIELRQMGLNSLEDRELVLQLVRTDSSGGLYFAGLIPAPWTMWRDFAGVRFGADFPSFRFLRLGEVMAGTLDAEVELVGHSDLAWSVETRVLVEDAAGTVLYDETRSVSVAASERKSVTWKAGGLDVTPVEVKGKPRNHFEIESTARQGDRAIVLYHNRLPFLRLDEVYQRQYLDPWLAGRPQSGEWEFRFAYMPTYRKAETSVDLDFFGVPERIRDAARYAVRVRSRGRRTPLAQGQAPIVNRIGQTMLLDLPDIREGTHRAEIALLDEAGRTIEQKQADFEHRTYDWTDNRLGKSDDVIPPFDPLRVTEPDRIAVWGRTYVPGAVALPSQILAGHPSGAVSGDAEPAWMRERPLLRTPVRLQSEANGTVATVTGATEIVSAAMDRAVVRGRGATPELSVTVDGFVEYDGWYETAVRVAARNGPTRIEALDLVIDLADTVDRPAEPLCPVDTLYVQRQTTGVPGANHFGAVPREPGVVFRSTELVSYRDGFGKDWKSFVPIVYAGNADQGVWFFAWSDAGWTIRDDGAVLVVERLDDGTVRLRVRLIAGPIELSEPRTLRFALQAAPIKPNDTRYRTRMREDWLAHDTSGSRKYGASCNSFVLEGEEDADALRRALIYGTRYLENPDARTQNAPLDNIYRRPWTASRLVLYGSTWMVGLGQEEYRTCGGEWLNNTLWKPQPYLEFSNQYNWQGTSQWTTPEQLTDPNINWTWSFNDFFIWHHRRLLDEVGINGTWWDNAEVGVVREYDPELGRMDHKWNLIYRRELGKRLNVMGWRLMRRPCWISNMHPEMSWNQVFWMIEGPWTWPVPEQTAFERWKLGEFRAMCRTKSHCQVVKTFRPYHAPDAERDRKVQRSMDAMCLSHDVPCFRSNGELFHKLNLAVDYENTDRCQFIGYWQTGRLIQTPGNTALVAVYRINPRDRGIQRRAAVLLLVNAGTEDADLQGTRMDAGGVLLGRPGQAVSVAAHDLETGEAIKLAGEEKTVSIAQPLPIKWHEFRALVLEQQTSE